MGSVLWFWVFESKKKGLTGRYSMEWSPIPFAAALDS